jgi:hypothetical protein
VRVLLGSDDGFVPNAPGQGNPRAYPWRMALAAVHEAVEGGTLNTGASA